MSKKQIIKGLEKLATKHGAEKLTEVVESIYCKDGVSTNGNTPACGNGQVWNEILKKCVDDIG